MVTLSSAKLRTRTGCLQCRKRRKKCDESRPQCAGCTRNKLPCDWPSEYQPLDRRTCSRVSKPHSAPSPVRTVVRSEIRSMRLRAPVSMPFPFQLEQHCYLYRYFGSNILPRLIRQGSLARYTDQGYMLRLALEFPPLMGVLVSIAGMHIASLDGGSIACAVTSYVQTLAGLRELLNDISDLGSHDALLATVVTLAVFETSRLDSTLQVAPHVMASGILLRNRQWRCIGRPQATAVFDRICIESFVYHASLMMIFDPSLDTLSDSDYRQELSALLSKSEHSTLQDSDRSLITQPILHGPYELFLLIADATRLARLSGAIYRGQHWNCTWNKLQQQLSQCKTIMDNDQDKCTELYFLAIDILLLKSSPDPLDGQARIDIETPLRKGLCLIPQINSSHYFPSFLLWPLAVLGCVCTKPSEVSVVRGYVSHLAESRLGGQALGVLNRLEHIWAYVPTVEAHSSLSAELRISGLQMLLDGEQVT